MYSPASLENAVQPSRLKCFSLQFFFVIAVLVRNTLHSALMLKQ